MDAGNGKSLDFRLSQALAYPVVKKGSPAATANPSLSTPTFCFFAGQPAYLRASGGLFDASGSTPHLALQP